MVWVSRLKAAISVNIDRGNGEVVKGLETRASHELRMNRKVGCDKALARER